MLPRRAALLGSGVIGAGWAARLLLSGVDVALYDPAPGGCAECAERSSYERAQARMVSADAGGPAGTWDTDTPQSTVAEAVAGAELVQESAPEREPLKLDLLARASQAAPADAIIASSTSGLLPTPDLVRDGPTPSGSWSRTRSTPSICCHWWSCAAARTTAPETIERAASLYRALGMHPLIVRHEIDGFIADRLLEAVLARGAVARARRRRDRSRRSTMRCATAPGCAGRRWVRS